jgi:DNA-binding beta-propeller fold protein YncE
LIGWGAALTALVAAFGIWQFQMGDAQANRGDAPKYSVDPSWPKALPHKWLVGQVPGIAVDKHDNVWIVQRARTLTNDERAASDFNVPVAPQPSTDLNGDPRPQGAIADCCLPAPAVLQFDPKGKLLRAWGGPADPDFGTGGPGSKCQEPNCQWPNTEHGIYVDHNMNLWLGGQAGGAVLKFTQNGDFLLQIGRRQPPVRNSNDTNGGINGTPLLAQPADMEVDPETNELYIADGYTNLRVIVVDAVTGLYKRHWGAYGQNPVNDAGEVGPYIKNQAPPRNFRNPVHAVRITKDGLVYVADRVNDRIQVFDKKKVGGPCPGGAMSPGQCGFVGEFVVEGDTLLNGSTWDVDVSHDKQQKFLFNADGSNQYIWTLNRKTGDILGRFGRNGRSAGQFHWVHNLAVDSKGNIYTAEVDTGKRAQKFTLKDDDDRDRGRDKDDDDHRRR